MIAVLDACTVLNLLQTVLDGRYISRLPDVFDKIVIHPTVHKEIQAKKYKNLDNDDDRITLDELLKSYIIRYVDREILHTDDFRRCCEILRKVTEHLDTEEGEYQSTALSLYLRIHNSNEDFNTDLLNIHFVSDDIRAKDEFNYFFRINQIGQIIDSIDIVTIFYLKGELTKEKLSDFCLSLKALYNKATEPLKQEVKRLQQREKGGQIQQVLSAVTECIYKSEIENLKRIRGDKNFKKLAKKEKVFADLFEKFVNDNPHKRIEYIEKRRREIENNYVWQM